VSQERDKLNRRWFVRTVGGVALVGAGTAGGILAARLASKQGAKGEDKVGAYYEDLPVDPALIRYELLRTIPHVSRAPRAIALDHAGRLTIAGADCVRLAAPDDQLEDSDTPGATFPTNGTATTVTIDADDQTWIATNHEIAIFDENAKRIRAFPLPIDEGIVTAIAVGEPGVFLADARNRVVAHCDREGKLIQRIGDRDDEKGNPGFVIPSPYFDLAIGHDGLLWVTNPGHHRIEAYTFAGRLETAWGKPSMAIEGFCGCCNPVNFARLPDGRFVTAEKGIPRVKIHRANGDFDSVVADSTIFSAALKCEDALNCRGKGLDVAVDSAGRVYVLDQVAGVVHVLAEKTAATTPATPSASASRS